MDSSYTSSSAAAHDQHTFASTSSIPSTLGQGAFNASPEVDQPYSNTSAASHQLMKRASTGSSSSGSQHMANVSSSGSAGSGGAGAGTGKYICPNCGKGFARDDLLRRHLAREARAMAQPQYDRQKSCHECARSKARCDLEVPSCGRCLSRGKTCHYGARSGNPNVRRVRDSMAPPSLSGMSITPPTSHQQLPANQGGGSQQYPYANSSWAGSSDYLSGSGQGGPPHSRRHSGDDTRSESSVDWSTDGGGSYQQHGTQLQRSYSSSSSASSRTDQLQQPSGPYPQPQFHQAPLIDNGSIVTPTTYMARHAFGGLPGPAGRSSFGNPLMPTEMDRGGGMGFKQEDGEETPIGRFVNSFQAGPSSMGPAASRMMHGGSDPGSIAAWNQQQQQQYGHPMTAGLGTIGAMGPGVGLPMGPPGPVYPLHRTYSGPMSQPSRPSPVGQRPQPHRLLTGANMPRPPATQTQFFGANPTSGKPLFSAMVDLSGWLEQPVAPSPLYPTGPSLASLAGSIPTGVIAGTGAESSGQAGSAEGTNMDEDTPVQQTAQQQQQQQPPIPASQYWWANPPSQSDIVLMQSVAQATATHLSNYPHLMVLPDPSSPVPPTVHRPWMAFIREKVPASLAIARVVLAGFAVRLPASEHLVWEQVARETRRLMEAHEAIIANGSDLEVFAATEALFFYGILMMMSDPGASHHIDMALTNSAFFGLSQLAKSLSMRLRASQARSRAAMAMSTPANSNATTAGDATAAASSSGDLKTSTATAIKTGPAWMTWGFEESMRRTLWAAYAILVLQRFRDGAVLSEGHLAGVDLILDVELPAVAAEFEAAEEDSWRKARSESEGKGMKGWTFRELVEHRPVNVDKRKKQTQQGGNDATPGNTTGEEDKTSTEDTPQGLLNFFGLADAFVSTVLSIAFCLDSHLSV